MASPTPRPWEVKDSTQIWDPMFATYVADCEVGYDEPRHELIDKAVANAEHIVRCVNAHDELVAALEGIAACGAKDCDHAWLARETLQKARGES